MQETDLQQFIFRLIMDKNFRAEVKKSPERACVDKGIRLNEKQLANVRAMNMDEIGKISINDVHSKLIERLAASLETERIVIS
ncbi:MAG: Os1348 family NHLP clan protein [Candidatus Lernaella stagnicola]|nr:Os1348 family NHLP clan protein [Candidatus Lernaella stagnicola]